jgi:hypothetical protein
MREMADMSEFWGTASELIQADAFDEYPHRNYDRLVDVVESVDSSTEAQAELGVSHGAIEKWCAAYGIESPAVKQQTLAQKLEQADPADISGETV